MIRRTRFLVSLAILLSLAWSAGASDTVQFVNVSTLEIEPFAYCSVPYKGTFSELPQALNALVGTMAAQNIAPTGDLIAIFRVYPNEEEIPESINFDVGFPISARAVLQPPLQIKTWEHSIVASATHSGPYSGLGDMIDKMFDWMEDNNYVQEGPILGKFIEVPSDYNQPRDYRTEIWIPIRKE